MSSITHFAQQAYTDQVFEKHDLATQIIEHKHFESCQFKQCIFDEATLLNCKFTDCEFMHCSLNTVTIKGSMWNNVTFDNSKVMGVNWTQARWPQIHLASPLQFFSCNISHSSFFGLALAAINIQDCKAHNCDFREADLSSSNLTNNDFYQSLFNKTNLAHADFSDALNYHFDITQNNAKKAIFSFPEVINLLHAFDITIKGLDSDLE